MNQNAVIALARQLTNAVMAEDWRAAKILAADLDAAWKEQQTYRAWTPFCQRNSAPEYKPGCCT